MQAKLLEDWPILFVLGCSCHCIHVCASDASKQLPIEMEDFCQDVYGYICRSPKRTNEILELQKFMKLKEPSI